MTQTATARVAMTSRRFPVAIRKGPDGWQVYNANNWDNIQKRSDGLLYFIMRKDGYEFQTFLYDMPED